MQDFANERLKIAKSFLRHPSSKIQGNERLMIIKNWPSNHLVPKSGNAWELPNIPHFPATKKFTKLFKFQRTSKCLQANLISQKVSYIEKLKTVKTIKTLKLTPSVYSKRAPFLSDQILKATANWLSTLKNLRELEIEFFPVKYGHYDQGLKQLAKCLAKPRKLKSITISFQKNAKIEADKLQWLTKSMRRLKQLKNLSLRIDDVAGLSNIAPFFNHFARLKQLENLTVKFDRYSLCKEDLSSFGASISQLSKLSILSLDIKCSSSMSNDDVIELFENIAIPEKTKKLELQIHFNNGNELITDKSIVALEEYLTMMDSLTHFSFLLTGLKKITNNCPISLVQDISKMPQIKFIELHFIECPQLTKYSYAALKDIQNNTKFNIKFGEAANIYLLLQSKH